MNLTTPAELPNGERVLVTLSPREARQRIEQLRRQIPDADPFTARRLRLEIEKLVPVAEPELAYGEWTV